QAENTIQSKNLTDLSSSKEYESNNSNGDDNSDNDFVDELDNNENANSIIDHFCAALEASFKKKGQPKLYTRLFARTHQRKKKVLKEAAVTDNEEDIEDHGSSERKYDNDNLENDNESDNSDGQGTIEASETVAKVINYSPWLAKCIYIDGHERLDVIAYHQTFLEEIAQLDQFMSKWLDQDLPSMLIMDHILCRAQLENNYYKKKDCDLMCANRDEYWNSVKLLEQVRKNALVAFKMNLNPGSSAPKMRDTIWNNDCQSMIIEDNYFIYCYRTLTITCFKSAKK
ncbi:5403_t:CDS:2, partial [Cetraspora pellucida]